MIKKTRNWLAILLMALPLNVNAQKSFEVNIWPNGTPVSNGVKDDVAKMNVNLPADKANHGRAVLICPGGGYGGLAMDNEGTNWIDFFRNQGIAAIVLTYRMPHGVKEVPIGDAEEAMRIIRRHAKEWNINPNDIGIMGSSAGGHLASTLSTHSKADVRPNFQILFYPVITMDKSYTHMGSHDNLLGKNASASMERLYSNDLQVTPQTPPAFITVGSNDQLVPPMNSINYYTALLRNHVPASMMVYNEGPHGYGSQRWFRYTLEMQLELKAWLASF
ncbi:MAG: alpha/beta hydrolase [Prevotella sp.]|nr:alpha/beta hydrolase [Prevotella sp.]